VHGYSSLKNAGEERLLEAAVTGKIPIWIAVDIAKTGTLETQRELLKAYEEKQIDYKSLKYVKGLMESRRRIGKQRGGGSSAVKPKTSIESMVNSYRKESQRQKLMIKRRRCATRLGFIVTAFLTSCWPTRIFTRCYGRKLYRRCPNIFWPNSHPRRHQHHERNENWI
jgi:ParB family chromosome partitioning protein